MIKYSLLSDQLWTQANFAAGVAWQVPVQPSVHKTEHTDQREGQKDEIKGDDRIGHKGVEGLVRKVIGVIERVTPLLERRKAGKEHQRRGVEQKDRLVGVGRPAKAQHGRPQDAAEPGKAGDAVSIGRLKITLGHGHQRAVENLGGIGGGVEKQHEQRPGPGLGQPIGVDGDPPQLHPVFRQQNKQLIPKEKLDEWMLKYKSWRTFVIESYNIRLNEMMETIDSLAFMNVRMSFTVVLYVFSRDDKQ